MNGEGLIAAIQRAYARGAISLDELESDLETALSGVVPGEWRSQWSTEEPAGPYSWFDPKYHVGSGT